MNRTAVDSFLQSIPRFAQTLAMRRRDAVRLAGQTAKWFRAITAGTALA
jgi:hypothetical protein